MFNKGDLVRYKDHCIQLEKAKENPAPFFVYSSKMVDLYGSGFKDHEIVEIQDANGEVFGDMEAEDLIVTVDGSKGLFDENGVRRPYDGLKYEVGEPNWYFHYSMPKFFDWPWRSRSSLSICLQALSCPNWLISIIVLWRSSKPSVAARMCAESSMVRACRSFLRPERSKNI